MGQSHRGLTQDEVQLGLGLEGVVQGDQEGRLADVLQHLTLSAGVLGCLRLLHDGGFLQNLGNYISHFIHLADAFLSKATY